MNRLAEALAMLVTLAGIVAIENVVAIRVLCLGDPKFASGCGMVGMYLAVSLVTTMPFAMVVVALAYTMAAERVQQRLLAVEALAGIEVGRMTIYLLPAAAEWLVWLILSAVVGVTWARRRILLERAA